MSIVSVIGPKGGIGKTTLSINTTAAMTRSLNQGLKKERVCLLDLDLRLPTISNLLDSHPRKTFYDLFETLANKTYQVDFLRTLYQVLTRFRSYLDGEIDEQDKGLTKSFAHYKNLNSQLFQFSEFTFSDSLHELFLMRGEIHTIPDILKLRDPLDKIDLQVFRKTIRENENNSFPRVDEYINFIEEYGFSIIGGEVPVLGKKNHRKRIHEPEFLLLFLEFLDQVFSRFDHVVLDTPAGGVNHLSSLMNVIDQVLFVFDLSNTIAINGSIDALHSFIDYYEDFCEDFSEGRLSGLDKAYVHRMVANQGEGAVEKAIRNKKLGIVFNRCQDLESVPSALKKLRDYLDTLDKYQQYKDKIHIVGMLPHHKIINITNNRGALFYNKDVSLTRRMDLIGENVLTQNENSPTLASDDKEIIRYLESVGKPKFKNQWMRIASSFT